MTSKRTFFILTAIAFIYFGVSLLVFTIINDGLHLMLGLNLMLAYIPFLIGYLAQKNKSNRLPVQILILFGWLIFFPNTMYMITDFIYIDYTAFQTQIHPYSPIEYVLNFEAYLGLFHIFVGAILGIFFGLQSLQAIRTRYFRSWFPKAEWLALLSVFFLSAIGIYIGRFFRYNSWEVYQVWNIVQDFIGSFSWESAFFIFSFLGIQAFLYYLFIVLSRDRPTT